MNPAAPTAAVPAPIDGAAGYAQLKAAVLGAQSAGGDSPLGSFPELAKLYSTAPELTKVQLNSAAPQYNTSVKVANDEAAASAAKAGKYQQIQKSDGGYAFYDPNGQEISAAQYAAVHGTDPAELLKHSMNPIDQQFRQDAKMLQDYMNNKANSKNDPKARAAAQATETQVRKLYNIKLHEQNPNEVINAFIKAYPTVYGGSAAGRQGGSSLLPSSEQLKANGKSSGLSGPSGR